MNIMKTIDELIEIGNKIIIKKELNVIKQGQLIGDVYKDYVENYTEWKNDIKQLIDNLFCNQLINETISTEFNKLYSYKMTPNTKNKILDLLNEIKA